MSQARLVITAVIIEGRSQADVSRCYGVSKAWVSTLVARYRSEGEAAFHPRSTRPHSSPNQTPEETAQLVVRLREELTSAGLDAGADTIGWHLKHHHDRTLSRSTINRILTRAGRVVAEPKKRPRYSYTRFQAEQPNETWQSNFTHYRLTRRDGTAGTDAEIITWLDDHSRYALHITAHAPVTATIVADTFTAAVTRHGLPASTLTDNGMVYTVRLASHGRRGGRTKLEQILADHGITQKNGSPHRPTTQGKVERFQQTMKNWLRAQPTQPRTLRDLQDLLDNFRDHYNQHRPHRSLPHHATPATTYHARPKAHPSPDRPDNPHYRVRHDRIDSTGTVTLRVAGRLRHIGIGRTHARTHVILLTQDLDTRVINAATGELLRELTIDPARDYQPTRTTKRPTPK